MEQHVRLKKDIPELDLHHGDMGIVRTKWTVPTAAYEVEFQQPSGQRVRAFLLPEHVQGESHR